MDSPESAVELFQGILGIGGLVAIIWAAGYVVFGHKQLRKDFDEHKKECREDKQIIRAALHSKADK